MIARSLIYWIMEKDFLRYLRPNILNDFNIDDIMLLERVTDDVVHSTVEQLGLDASKIAPPPQGYQPRPAHTGHINTEGLLCQIPIPFYA